MNKKFILLCNVVIAEKISSTKYCSGTLQANMRPILLGVISGESLSHGGWRLVPGSSFWDETLITLSIFPARWNRRRNLVWYARFSCLWSSYVGINFAKISMENASTTKTGGACSMVQRSPRRKRLSLCSNRNYVIHHLLTAQPNVSRMSKTKEWFYFVCTTFVPLIVPWRKYSRVGLLNESLSHDVPFNFLHGHWLPIQLTAFTILNRL